MHPIERLRYVARASGAPQDLLVSETAAALAAFRADPAGLVAACRRIVSRQVTSGPIWWLCSRVLCALDPVAEAYAAADDIAGDPTWRHLATELPPDATVAVLGWQPVVFQALERRGDVEVLVVDVLGEAPSAVRALEQRDVVAVEVPVSGLGAAINAADLVVVEASAAGPGAALGVAGSLAAACVAARGQATAWVAIGRGRMLPGNVWNALASRVDDEVDPWDRADEFLSLDLFDAVIGPNGPASAADAVALTDCPVAPELFKPEIT